MSENDTSSTAKKISVRVFDPRNAMFKCKDNSRAEVKTLWCTNTEQCPLLKQKQCVHNLFLGSKCPHGWASLEVGPTKRAKKFYAFISEAKKEAGDILNANWEYPSDKMVKIGDYAYLPYSHMNMNEKVPFLEKGGAFRHGNDFMKWEDFNPACIRSIVLFRPQALFGGEIRDYQKKIVPNFILHLKESFPDLYEQFFAENSDLKERFNYGQQQNHVGRKAFLLTTVPPFDIITGKDKKHSDPVTWHWDGKKLTTEKIKLLFFEWEENEQIKMEVIPSERTTVVITDNAQVGKDTKFLD